MNRQAHFNKLCQLLKCEGNESLSVSYEGEESTFVRFNHAKVRQAGSVDQGVLSLTYYLRAENASAPDAALGDSKESQWHKLNRSFDICGDYNGDAAMLLDSLAWLRQRAPQLPFQAHTHAPTSSQQSEKINRTSMLASQDVAAQILKHAEGTDFVGYYQGGPVYRGLWTSSGASRWFEDDNFVVDYSLFSGEQALSSAFAGSDWNASAFAAQLQSDRTRLEALNSPKRELKPGPYRVYLAPAAVADLCWMLSWGGISEHALQMGVSPLKFLRTNERSLSPKFMLWEDFSSVHTPRFNEEGELAPEQMLLVEGGKLKNTLSHSSTAKEFSTYATGASFHESMRAPSLDAGSLAHDDILNRLDTGLYISNLHYLNWSDQTQGRITGMTRFACAWVENGQIAGPIKDMRFDESLFNVFGKYLEDLTAERSFIAESNTYFSRHVGGINVPGALLSQIQFTL